MYKCKHCGALLEDGMLCNCAKSQKERAMMKEAMATSLKYLEMLEGEDDGGVVELNEAFRVVMTELAEKYGEEPKEFMSKVIDALEEFVEEEE